jgi:hypothetical protein
MSVGEENNKVSIIVVNWNGEGSPEVMRQGWRLLKEPT